MARNTTGLEVAARRLDYPVQALEILVLDDSSDQLGGAQESCVRTEVEFHGFAGKVWKVRM